MKKKEPDFEPPESSNTSWNTRISNKTGEWSSGLELIWPTKSYNLQKKQLQTVEKGDKGVWDL